MTPPRRHASVAEIVAARLYQRIGFPGALGLALLLVAALMLVQAWRQHQHIAQDASSAALRGASDLSPAKGGTTTSQARQAASLPPATDSPLLLTRIQRAAVDAGLGWPRADYRFNAASDEAPASLEVQCTLKGPYLAIRRFVTALLQDTPTLTLREFSLGRTNADTVDVEAKLSIIVYLASDAAPVAAGLR